MKIDNRFRDLFIYYCEITKADLVKRSLDVYDTLEGSLYNLVENSLFLINPKTFQKDSKYAREFIMNSLIIKSHYRGRKIIFEFEKTYISDNATSEMYLKNQKELWEATMESYSRFFGIDENKVILNNLLKDIKPCKGNYTIPDINSKDFATYIRRGFGEFFPDFKFNKNYSTGTVRYLKPINEEIFFGFQYNEKNYKSDFWNNNEIRLIHHDDIEFIIVHKDYDKRLEKKDQKDEENIFEFGTFTNPFYAIFCSDLNYIIASIITKPYKNEWKIKKEDIEEDFFIRYPVFVIALKSYFVKPIIKYYEKILIDNINRN